MRYRRDLNRSLLTFLLLLSIAGPVPAVPQSPEHAEVQDGQKEEYYACGVLSLATLSRLEGRPVTPEQIADRLTRRKTHSLSQIREAAGSFGLSLRGVRIDLKRGLLDRPALVRLDRGPYGHFVVIRPIGHSGKLIQILDSTTGVRVEDAETLAASGEWTGLGLIPDRYPKTTWIVLAMLGIPSLCYLTYRSIRKNLTKT